MPKVSECPLTNSINKLVDNIINSSQDQLTETWVSKLQNNQTVASFNTTPRQSNSNLPGHSTYGHNLSRILKKLKLTQKAQYPRESAQYIDRDPERIIAALYEANLRTAILVFEKSKLRDKKEELISIHTVRCIGPNEWYITEKSGKFFRLKNLSLSALDL